MRNTPAAIEAYRRAVDINARDYRAWYGLGQTYEILQMYAYSIYYFGKAAALRPYDPRMWYVLFGSRAYHIEIVSVPAYSIRSIHCTGDDFHNNLIYYIAFS